MLLEPTKEQINFSYYLADQAAGLALKYFRKSLDFNKKQDQSPLTQADLAIEAYLHELIEKEYPRDGILGEESSNKSSQSGWTWVIDPIDGTRAFAAGIPLFNTMITLCYWTTPVLSIINCPYTQERWTGVLGQAATFNNKPIKTRACRAITNAFVSIYDPFPPQVDKEPQKYQWMKVLAQQAQHLVYQGASYHGGLIAQGCLDLYISLGMGPHDYLPLSVILEGAGGVVVDWNGQKLNMKSGKVPTIIAGDECLIPLVQEFLRKTGALDS